MQVKHAHETLLIRCELRPLRDCEEMLLSCPNKNWIERVLPVQPCVLNVIVGEEFLAMISHQDDDSVI